MNGVCKMITTYGDALNDEVFKDKLGVMSVKALIRAAKERRSGSLGYAEVMVLEYNGRKKEGSIHRLLLSKLYAREQTAFIDIDDDTEEFIDHHEEEE